MTAIEAPWPGAVAVSGGSDSLALMHLLSDWTHVAGLSAPVVVTVDHGLRDDAGATARSVVGYAERAGLEVDVLHWHGRKPTGNIEATARDARYVLLGRWCRSRKISSLFVGHTQDDQAETFLLRLARGTGLDGLAAMATVAAWPVCGFGELCVVRPLLCFSRQRLRGFLEEKGVAWHDDPMNVEERFARNRIRAIFPALEKAGLTKVRIADAASHIARARLALELSTQELLARVSRPQDNGVALDVARLAAAPREIALRALAELLMSVGGEAYRPRFGRLEALYDALALGKFHKARTLHNCLLSPVSKASSAAFGSWTVIVAREAGAHKSKDRRPRRAGAALTD